MGRTACATRLCAGREPPRVIAKAIEATAIATPISITSRDLMFPCLQGRHVSGHGFGPVKDSRPDPRDSHPVGGRPSIGSRTVRQTTVRKTVSAVGQYSLNGLAGVGSLALGRLSVGVLLQHQCRRHRTRRADSRSRPRGTGPRILIHEQFTRRLARSLWRGPGRRDGARSPLASGLALTR